MATASGASEVMGSKAGTVLPDAAFLRPSS